MRNISFAAIPFLLEFLLGRKGQVLAASVLASAQGSPGPWLPAVLSSCPTSRGEPRRSAPVAPCPLGSVWGLSFVRQLPGWSLRGAGQVDALAAEELEIARRTPKGRWACPRSPGPTLPSPENGELFPGRKWAGLGVLTAKGKSSSGTCLVGVARPQRPRGRRARACLRGGSARPPDAAGVPGTEKSLSPLTCQPRRGAPLRPGAPAEHRRVTAKAAGLLRKGPPTVRRGDPDAA